MTEYNTTAYAPGTRVVVTDEFGSHLGTSGINAGATLVVTSCRKTVSSGYQVRVALPVEYASPDPVVEVHGEYGTDWFVPAKGIPFALTKETSKQYAAKSNSARLEDFQRRVLDAAAKGKEVDAVEFRKAVVAALSLAATRAGKSMARREYAKMARHLLYIVDAVIDNALAGLPPVEPGARSPKIREQEREIADLRATVTRLTGEADRAAGELTSAVIALVNEQERTTALIQEKTDLELSVEALAATLEYARGLMANAGQDSLISQTYGYEDGYRRF